MMSSNKSVDDNLHVEGKKKKKKKPVIIISLLNLLFPQVSSEQAKMCVYEWICGLHEIVRCQWASNDVCVYGWILQAPQI